MLVTCQLVAFVEQDVTLRTQRVYQQSKHRDCVWSTRQPSDTGCAAARLQHFWPRCYWSWPCQRGARSLASICSSLLNIYESHGFSCGPTESWIKKQKFNSKKKTHILLGAPVSASLVSCAAASGCRPCPSPSPALPDWPGIRSPGWGSGSDSGSCPPPGRTKGLSGSRSPLPSSPVWGSRHQTPCLHCGPVSWTA